MIVLYLADKQSVGFIKESAMQSLIDKMGEHLTILRNKLRNSRQRNLCYTTSTSVKKLLS